MSETGSEQVKKLVIAVSSGSGTGTVTETWLLARWIRVHPIAETDSFHVIFKDGEGFIMLDRDNVGTFSERLEMSLGILKTIEITGATQDGVYICHFDCH